MSWAERFVAKGPRVRPGSPLAYVAAAALVAVTLGVRFVLREQVVGAPYLTFFFVSAVSAYIGGFGPGLLATVLGALGARFILRPLPGTFGIVGLSDIPNMLVYLVVSSLACLVISRFNAALANLRDARRREQAFTAGLERLVAERTHELELANRRLKDEMIERERLEGVARQSQKLEAVGQLTGGVAHDFNNLLTIILGNLETAEAALGGREPEIARQIQSAVRGAERGARLTQRLLAFARRQPLAPTVIDPNQLIEGMSELMRRTLGEDIDIELALASGLWRAHLDAHQLETSLLNLVVNARDAMPEGGTLRIETANVTLAENDPRLEPDLEPGDYVMIAVRDSGEGMPDDVRARAFEPFFTTKEVGQGTGLGLSMVFGFIKQSGGHVKIASERDRGTTVELYIPRLRENREATATAARPPDTAGVREGAILVVEDEDEVREYATRTLRELGYRVYGAADGISAIDLLRGETPIDLLFTDIVLPKMNGREVATAALELRPDIKVLFTTGYAREATPSSAAVLAKPFTAATLAATVAAALTPPAA